MTIVIPRIGNKKMTSGVVEQALEESAESVMSTFDFLAGEQVVDVDDDNDR